MDDRAFAMINDIFGRIAKKNPTPEDLAYIEGVLKTLIATYKPEIRKHESWWQKLRP